MKQFLWAVVALAGFVQLGSAAPVCTNGSLGSYIGLGSTGCMIGSTIFSGFSALSGTAGGTAIPTTSISVMPVGGLFDPGFTFTTNQTATTGQILESLFTYNVNGGGNIIAGNTVTLSNTSVTGDGAVSDVQDYCLMGNFGSNGVTGCTGTPRSDALVGNGTTTDALNRPFLQLTHDFTIDGGTAGTATGGTLSDRFALVSTSAVPEPATTLLAGMGLALALASRFRRRKGIVSKD